MASDWCETKRNEARRLDDGAQRLCHSVVALPKKEDTCSNWQALLGFCVDTQIDCLEQLYVQTEVLAVHRETWYYIDKSSRAQLPLFLLGSCGFTPLNFLSGLCLYLVCWLVFDEYGPFLVCGIFCRPCGKFFYRQGVLPWLCWCILGSYRMAICLPGIVYSTRKHQSQDDVPISTGIMETIDLPDKERQPH